MVQQIKKYSAFNLMEAIIAMTLVGFLSAIMISVYKPQDEKKLALEQLGISMYAEVDEATTQLIAQHSYNYEMKKLIKADGVSKFSITDLDAADSLIELYKQNLKATRGTVPDEIKQSGYHEGFMLTNGAYFTLQTFGNCVTRAVSSYYPSHNGVETSEENACGYIFIDVNGADAPNEWGVDWYQIALGNAGVR